MHDQTFNTDPRAVLHAIALKFVQPSFRERFVHEALKKPWKLMSRVCHETDRIFLTRYKNGSVGGTPGEAWFLLDRKKGFRNTTWEEVSSCMKSGSGMLAIDFYGNKFYAESEDSSGMERWAGEG